MMLVMIIGDNDDGSVEVSTGRIEECGPIDPESPALHLFQKMENFARAFGAGISEIPK